MIVIWHPMLLIATFTEASLGCQYSQSTRAYSGQGSPNPRHPFGLRGVGEGPIIPPLAAVANAVYHATGARLRKLPLTPGAVLAALAENG